MSIYDDTNKEYKYRDVPLYPAICKELILELFNKKGDVTIKVIIKEVTNLHISRGGKNAQANDIRRMFSLALRKLKKDGCAENPARTHWRICDDKMKESSIDKNNEITEVEPLEDIKEKYNLTYYGEGDKEVYLYFLPNYKAYAESNGEKFWRCKIGESEDSLRRVLDQVSTALPENPIITIIRFNKSKLLENLIHKTLEIKDRKIMDIRGEEWFFTNPEEFLSIYYQCIERS
ncbi:GIY-YIG nuclease family protein [Rossellomorea sp. NS-SX7]|uniref:GIY-YIG nuclease family protein n=1 Tax=Rossellomorea sp. NS-SX7 TaxID=3463856 RepID=UPI004059254D